MFDNGAKRSRMTYLPGGEHILDTIENSPGIELHNKVATTLKNGAVSVYLEYTDNREPHLVQQLDESFRRRPDNDDGDGEDEGEGNAF